MAWKLHIFNPTGTTRTHVLSNESASGVSGGFKWQKRGNGDCVQLEFGVINSVAQIPPRAIVLLEVNGAAQFWGVVSDPPSLLSREIQTLRAVGGRELLRAQVTSVYADKSRDVEVLAQRLIQLDGGIALNVLPPDVAALSGELELFYRPTDTLDSALEALAKTCNCVHGVSATGQVFFRSATDSATTSITAPRSWRYLHAQDREVCTKAVLRLLTAPNDAGLGAVDTRAMVSGQTVQYVPATRTMSVTHPDHAIYDAVRAFDLGGANVMQRGSGLSEDTLLANLNARTGGYESAGNGAYFALSRTWTAQHNAEPYGVTFTYTLAETTNVTDGLVKVSWTIYSEDDAVGANWTEQTYHLPLAPLTQPRTVRILLPRDARHGMAWTRSVLTIDVTLSFAASDTAYERKFAIYDIFPLASAVTEDAAKSFLRVPYASPAEVEVDGLLAPTPLASALGQTVEAPIWDYEHTSHRPATTRIRLGSEGQSVTARAIRLAVGS